ncbi:glycoside hydrolase family 17 protein [Dongia sp. agr-C8]
MRGIFLWLPPLLVAVALTVAAWAWLGRPVDLPPAPEAKLHCASYTPFRGDQTPFDPTMIIPKAQIEEDLKQLQPVTDCIRTYAVNQGIDQAVPVAAELGMKVLLGIWIGRNPVDNEAQIKTAIELAKAHPETVKAIIVGNEVLLRGEQTGETLAEMAKRIKAESGARVTYADVWEFWLRAPDVLKQAVDFITIHILPYWEDDPLPVSAAVKHLETIVAEVQEKFPGREIVIGETGWPSAGRWREDAAPSIVNQARYLREFLVYAKAHDLDYNFIEAFDQPWKRYQEGTAGGFWGLFHEDRTPKFSWDQPVSNYPSWPSLAGVSLVLGLGILVVARFWRHSTGNAARFLSAIGAMLAGAALVLHFPHAWLAARSNWEWLLECAIGIQTLATAVLLIAVTLAGRLRDSGASLLEGIAWIRRPLRGPTIRESLAVLRLAALLGAATVSLGLSFDPRYKDFPIAAYLVPALFFLAADIARGGLFAALADRREEAGFALLLAGTAVYVFVNETPLNLMSDIWVVLTLLLAVPGIGAWRGIFQRRTISSNPASKPTAASPVL